MRARIAPPTDRRRRELGEFAAFEAAWASAGLHSLKQTLFHRSTRPRSGLWRRGHERPRDRVPRRWCWADALTLIADLNQTPTVQRSSPVIYLILGLVCFSAWRPLVVRVVANDWRSCPDRARAKEGPWKGLYRSASRWSGSR